MLHYHGSYDTPWKKNSRSALSKYLKQSYFRRLRGIKRKKKGAEWKSHMYDSLRKFICNTTHLLYLSERVQTNTFLLGLSQIVALTKGRKDNPRCCFFFEKNAGNRKSICKLNFHSYFIFHCKHLNCKFNV